VEAIIIKFKLSPSLLKTIGYEIELKLLCSLIAFAEILEYSKVDIERRIKGIVNTFEIFKKNKIAFRFKDVGCGFTKPLTQIHNIFFNFKVLLRNRYS